MTFRLLARIAALAICLIGADAALTENRMLVIDNANHASASPLANPANDAMAPVQVLSTAASFARADGRR